MTITIISTLRDRTPVPQEKPLADAQVIWGSPSNFSWGSQSKNLYGDPSIRGGGIALPDDPENQPVGPPITYNWRETSRRERTVRIDGPDGAYVDFARIEEITFRLPDQEDGRQVYVVQTFSNGGDEAGSTGSTAPITPKIIIVPPST